MHALFLLICKKDLTLKFTLGGTSGRKESLDLSVRDEVEEDTKNDAEILACEWWNCSLGEGTLNEDQLNLAIDKFGFGLLNSRHLRRTMTYIWIY